MAPVLVKKRLENDMFRKLRGMALERWENWGLGRKPSDISFIRRGSTWLGDAGKVVFIAFGRGDRVPTLIAKTVISCEYGRAILNEAQHIKKVWDSASIKFRQTLPHPLDVIEIEGIPVYFEEATPGVAFPEKVMFCWGKKKKEKLLSETIRKLVLWLDDFQTCINHDKKLIDFDLVNERILKPLDYFCAKHDVNAREQYFIEELREIAASVESKKIPLQPAHGDLWGGSLLWGIDGTMRVIDWEFFEPQRLPLQDFLYFAIHPGFVMHNMGKSGLLSEFMNLFRENYYSALIRDHLKVHAKAAGVESSEILKSMLAVLLVQLSIERDFRNKSQGKWMDLFRYLLQHRSECVIFQS
jgi:hypothetical protein